MMMQGLTLACYPFNHHVAMLGSAKHISKPLCARFPPEEDAEYPGHAFRHLSDRPAKLS